MEMEMKMKQIDFNVAPDSISKKKKKAQQEIKKEFTVQEIVAQGYGV